MTNEPITKDGRRRVWEALTYLHDATSAEGPASREEAEMLSGVMTMLAFAGIDVARRVRTGPDLDPHTARVLDEFEEHITRAGSLSQQFLGLVQHPS
ncbi:hypothetical protein ABZX92_05410 [Lentzea sp. NPDC006480]|uniref:hypothetical protein n=1 Tax=Lentzea sp. NPDC006480 TaxID=3157176 RepID=UPI0033ADBE81